MPWGEVGLPVGRERRESATRPKEEVGYIIHGASHSGQPEEELVEGGRNPVGASLSSRQAGSSGELEG